MSAVMIEPEVRFYTRSELCRRYRVSEKTIRNWEDRGLLRPLRISGTIRYPAEQIEELELRGRDERPE